MAYDEDLGNRIRELLADEDGVREQRMFGGLAFLIGGHMAVSASGQGGLLLRCEPAQTVALLEKPHAGPFEMRGRTMHGWLRVAPEGVRGRCAARPAAPTSVRVHPGIQRAVSAAALFAVLVVAGSISPAWAAEQFGAAGLYVRASIAGVTGLVSFARSIALCGASSLTGSDAAVVVLRRVVD